jgi:hypothetical protein
LRATCGAWWRSSPRKLVAFKSDCAPTVFSHAPPAHQKARRARQSVQLNSTRLRDPRRCSQASRHPSEGARRPHRLFSRKAPSPVRLSHRTLTVLPIKPARHFAVSFHNRRHHGAISHTQAPALRPRPSIQTARPRASFSQKAPPPVHSAALFNSTALFKRLPVCRCAASIAFNYTSPACHHPVMTLRYAPDRPIICSRQCTLVPRPLRARAAYRR